MSANVSGTFLPLSRLDPNSGNAKGWQTKVEGGTAYIGEIRQYGVDFKPNEK